MSKSFDERKNAFESKFTHDAAMRFRAESRRNKLVGLWAAEKMGMDDSAAKGYVGELIAADMKEAGDDDVLRKLSDDFKARGVSIADADIRAKLDQSMQEAKRQIADEA